LIYLSHSYKKSWHATNFYERAFIQYIRFHGGDNVIKACLKLEQMAKTLPYPKLLLAFGHFLSELGKISGLRDGSFQTRVIEHIDDKSNETAESQPKNAYCVALFFNAPKASRKAKKDAVLRESETIRESFSASNSTYSGKR
jgi:hypothetical protein